jgi:ABC-type glutathione transport system ATPase component
MAAHAGVELNDRHVYDRATAERATGGPPLSRLNGAIQGIPVMNNPETIVSLKQVSMEFWLCGHILHAIDLDIVRGQTVAIIGESGCGKTVTLKLIVGLLRPTDRLRLFRWSRLERLSPRPSRPGNGYESASCFRVRPCLTV